MGEAIVVGAGAAGLMAALELVEHGHDVTVLEARQRVGGRIHTLELGDGVWANAGAEWLNTSDQLAHELVRRYDLELVDRFGFERLALDGRLSQRATPPARVASELERLAGSLTDVEHPWDDAVARDLDRLSIADFLRDFDLETDELQWMLTDIRGEFMVHAHEASLASYALVTATTDGDRSTRFANGTAALPRAMSEELGSSRVHLGEPVVQVRHDSTSVEVQTTGATYTADVLILALPLMPLRDPCPGALSDRLRLRERVAPRGRGRRPHRLQPRPAGGLDGRGSLRDLVRRAAAVRASRDGELVERSAGERDHLQRTAAWRPRRPARPARGPGSDPPGR